MAAQLFAAFLFGALSELGILVPFTVAWHIPSPMPTEIVVCRAGEFFTREGDSERVCIFTTETGSNIGSRFTCEAMEIPWQVQRAVDTFGKVEAEVCTERDVLGDVQFKRFIV